jgi:hypothetical protein
MAKFLCKCGETLRISGAIPNPIESHIIPDSDLEAFVESARDADGLYPSGIPMLRCPNCDRLWIYWDGWDGPPNVYRLELERPSGY